MASGNNRLAQRLIAIVVIVAILGVIGVSPAILIFFLIAGLVIWRTVRRSEDQETGRIFEFYVTADEILRDEGRQWYGFEIAEVIDKGETVLATLPDAPPLARFGLGALYHLVGEHEAAIEHLSWVVENERSNESHLVNPSPQLRRYVETLRRIEREPAIAPQTLGAVRNLERARSKRAAKLLDASRRNLADLAVRSANNDASSEDAQVEGEKSPARPLSLITPPPPISEVLRDLYQAEDKRTA